MIRELENHLTQAQVDGIKEIIVTQYRRYQRLTNSPEFQNLFLEEYRAHEKQHSISWAIASGFPSNRESVGGLQNICLKYSGGHTRPMLQNEHIVIHILNHTTHFDAQYLKTFYQMNSNHFTAEQLYCYFKFWVENKTLTKVMLCLPDETGKVVEKEVLLERNAIIQLAS